MREGLVDLAVLLKGVAGGYAYAFLALYRKMGGIDLEVSCALREKDVGSQVVGLVVTVVIVLQLRLVAGLQALVDKAGEGRQLGVPHIFQIDHVRVVQPIGEYDRFLLLNLRLGYDGTYEDLAVGHIAVLGAVLLLRGFLVGRQHLDTYAVRLVVLAVHPDGSRTDGEGTFALGEQRIGEALFVTGCPLSVDKRGAAAHGGERSAQDVKIRELRGAQVGTLLVNGETYLERFPRYHLVRSKGLEDHLVRPGR